MVSGKIVVKMPMTIKVNHSIKAVTKSLVEAQNYTTFTRRFSELGFLCFKDISNFERINRATMRLIMPLLIPDAQFKGIKVDLKFQSAAFELVKSVVHKSADGRAGVLDNFNILMAKRPTSPHKISSLITIRCLLDFPESLEVAFKTYKFGKKTKIDITDLAAMTLRDAVQLSFKVEGTEDEKRIEALIWQEIYVAMDILVKCNDYDHFRGKIPATLQKYNVLKFFAQDDPMNMESSLSKKENRPDYYNRIEELSLQMMDMCQVDDEPDNNFADKNEQEIKTLEESLSVRETKNLPKRVPVAKKCCAHC